MQLADARVVGGLREQRAAELRLAAGPLVENDEFFRHAHCDLAAQVDLDHAQRHVDAGRDAGRCPDAARA